nr:hypothetical protein [Aeromonas media]
MLLPQIWRDGYRYQKGGVMLSEFTPKGQQQADLFAPSSAQSDAPRAPEPLLQLPLGGPLPVAR